METMEAMRYVNQVRYVVVMALVIVVSVPIRWIVNGLRRGASRE